MRAMFWNSALLKLNQGNFSDAADLGWDAFNSLDEPDPAFLDQVLTLFMKCREELVKQDLTAPGVAAHELLILERTMEVAGQARQLGSSQLDIPELERITELMITEARTLRDLFAE